MEEGKAEDTTDVTAQKDATPSTAAETSGVSKLGSPGVSQEAEKQDGPKDSEESMPNGDSISPSSPPPTTPSGPCPATDPLPTPSTATSASTPPSKTSVEKEVVSDDTTKPNPTTNVDPPTPSSTPVTTPMESCNKSTTSIDQLEQDGENKKNPSGDANGDADAPSGAAQEAASRGGEVENAKSAEVVADNAKTSGKVSDGSDGDKGGSGGAQTVPKEDPLPNGIIWPIKRTSPRLATLGNPKATVEEHKRPAYGRTTRLRAALEDQNPIKRAKLEPKSSPTVESAEGSPQCFDEEPLPLHRHKHFPELTPKDFTVEQEDWLRFKYQETTGKFRARRALDEFEEHYKCYVRNPQLKDDLRLAECLITNVFRRHERRLRQKAAEEAGEPIEPAKKGQPFKGSHPRNWRTPIMDKAEKTEKDQVEAADKGDEADKGQKMDEDVASKSTSKAIKGEAAEPPSAKKQKTQEDNKLSDMGDRPVPSSCRDIWVEDLKQNDVVKVLFTDPQRWLPGIVRGVSFVKGKATIMFSDGPFDIDNGDIFQLIDLD